MIVVCRPASRVMLIGSSCVVHVHAGSVAMLRPATRPLSTAGFQSTSQGAAAACRVGGLGDVAGGVDVGVAGAQVLVDEDAALARQPGRARELHARAHADGDGDEVAGDHVAAAGLHRRHPAAASADGGQVGERVDLHALAPQRQLDDARLGLGEHVAPVAVLAHEVVHVHAAGAQALDDLERRDAAADHDRRLAPCGSARTMSRASSMSSSLTTPSSSAPGTRVPMALEPVASSRRS